MKSKIASLLSIAGFIAATFFTSSALAADHKVVIQVSSKDPQTQTIALNVASNVQKHYGMDNVTIEIVAFGPGLSILTRKSPQSKRVSSLSQSDIKFSACANTMAKIEKKTGNKPKLTEGVAIVPAGAVRLMELQEQGYSYLKP
ncbi:MAG: DsrE family protein [Gammaproteobacteria bacterium]|nr:DsrE family protein [Gammaproteobacteria bacterium]